MSFRIQNDVFTLTLSDSCIAESLILNDTGRECLTGTGERLPLFTVTQERPFNNEVKLAHPNKQYTYSANRAVLENGVLTVGFDTAFFEAILDLKIFPRYLTFTLREFRIRQDMYPCGMRPAPVSVFRMLQLPLTDRGEYGEWMNVLCDGDSAVSLMAASPYVRSDSEVRCGSRVLYTELFRSVSLKNQTVALFAAPDSERLLDAVDDFEHDYGLPLGVESRRSDAVNHSIFFTDEINPENCDRILAYVKQGGFRYMQIYYTAIFRERNGYSLCGDYDYREEYPEGRESLRKMLDRIKAAGITPGFHFLQTHIGLESRYVTPVCDSRIRLRRYFALAKPLSENDTVLHVTADPEGCDYQDGARLLNFGGELISYEGFDSEKRCFTGCRRGACRTYVKSHPAGEIGGVLDVSEFGMTSAYIDQQTNLQDEVGDKIADAYNAGFCFCYCDGSEGANPPYEVYVPDAQYKIYRKLDTPPLFFEGAAKAHFGWHFQAGGNAFDIFKPHEFKAKIDEFPAAEAPHLRRDFTQLNFGWFGFWAPEIQPDMYEYGTSHAAGWNCPVAVQFSLEKLDAHPRTPDILETFRRWEQIRDRGGLSDEEMESLRTPGREHHLLLNESGNLELVRVERMVETEHLRAQLFTRGSRVWAAVWSPSENRTADLKLPFDKLEVRKGFDSERIPVPDSVIPLGDRIYLTADLPTDELASLLEHAEIL